MTTKNSLTLGRTLGVLDAGAAIVGGIALVALSGGLAPIAFGVAAAGTGLYRSIAMARGWNNPKTFITSTVETGSTKTNSINTTDISLFGSVARLGAGFSLMTAALALGGPAGAALLGTGLFVGVIGGLGTMAAATILTLTLPFAAIGAILALPFAAVAGYHKLRTAIKIARTPGGTKAHIQSLKSRVSDIDFKGSLKAAFNKLLPTKDHTPLFSVTIGMADKVTSSTRSRRRPGFGRPKA